jgi:hypothetical protein
MSMSFSASRKLQLAVAGAVIGTLLAGQAAEAAVAFSDNFSTSTMNAASPAAPVATKTNYAVLSSKNATASSIAPGDLKINMGSTSSGFVEAQALFSATPLALAASGDYVQLQFTFTNTARIVMVGNSTINVGLYDSNGTTPVTGGQMNNGQMVDTQSAFSTGNAQLWTGYAGRISSTNQTSASSITFTRPAQNGASPSNENQDLLFSNAGGGAFDDPAGTTLGATASSVAPLTESNQYTITFKLTRGATGLVTADYNLYNGVGTGGTNLFSSSRNASASQTTAGGLEFDALAIGWRYAGATGDPASTMDISALEVTTNLPVPEPTSLAVLGLGAFGVLCRRRTR